MDKLKLMTAFVAVAEEESFAGGARKIGMSPPAVTRAIATLESQLGVKLIDRTTRIVRVTSIGKRYLVDSRRILDDIEEANDSISGINAEPRGRLAVTSPVLFGKRYILPGVVKFMWLYPAIKVSAIFLDRTVNLLEEQFDVGIQIGALRDSSIKAIYVGNVRPVTCASSNYLKKNGTPKTPADLSEHNIISTNISSSTIVWKFRQQSKLISIRVNPKLTVISNDEAYDAAMLGYGIAKLNYQAFPSDSLSEEKLKIILTEFEPDPLPIYLLHHEGRYPSAKIRSFINFITSWLRNDKDIN